MIVVLKHNVPDEKRNQLITWLRNQQIDVHPSLGEGADRSGAGWRYKPD
mgnify:CR=1 FL=1